MKLSIIIPARNEENRIGRMLDAYLPYFSNIYKDEVELLVVINGSNDGTLRVVEEYEAKYSCLKHIVDPAGIGKGGALILGFSSAKGDLIGFSDADGSTPPESFQDLVKNIKDTDCIIASRWCRGAKVSPQQPLLRRFASRVFNIFIRIMFGLRLTDTQCGAKLMRRDAILHVIPLLTIKRWAFDVDLLVQLKSCGYKTVEIPTVWNDIYSSGGRVFSMSIDMFISVVRLRLLRSPFRWVLQVYDKSIGRIIHIKQ